MVVRGFVRWSGSPVGTGFGGSDGVGVTGVGRLSDREAIGRLRCDIRWKAAAGLSLTDEGFHPTVLTLWRARLRNSSAPERVFDAVRTVVAETGVLSGRNRRVLDSTVLDDAVATQDTVTMITAQIRGCRRLIAQARQTVVSHDYEQPGRPSCDWGDPQSRSRLINRLVADGLTVLESVEGAVLDPEQTDAVGLLAVVVGQDTEPDPEREGKWRACIHVCVRRVLYCCGWCESRPERRVCDAY